MTGRTISIVGGGWSMLDVNQARIPGEIIAVNDSAFYLKRKPNYIVSMDRLWTEHRWSMGPGASEGLAALGIPSYIRRSALKNCPWQVNPWGWLHPFDCLIDEPMMSLDPAILNGPNSGHCAINLAFTMKPQTVFLFGFDMCRNERNEAYWFPPYAWTGKPQGATSVKRYEEWAIFMKMAAEQFSDLGCKVFNVSPRSLIPYFEKIAAAELGVSEVA
jgi:hypothetical protein